MIGLLTSTSAQAMIVAGVAVSQTVALYSFDHGNGYVAAPDLSDGDTLAVFRGNAALSNAQARFGTTSLRLDGTGDYVLLYEKNVDDLTFYGADRTVEMFFRPDDLTGTQALICKFDGSLDDDILLRMVGGEIQLLIYNSGSSVVNILSTTAPVTALNWHHVAATYNAGTNEYALYLDGTRVGVATPSAAPSANTGPLYIGRNSQATANDFGGYVSEFRFSHTVRYTGASFTPPAAPFTQDRAVEAATNPDFANVSHLAGWEGFDGGIGHGDEGATGPLLTFGSGATISTAQAKFGNSSLLLNNTNNGYVTISHQTENSMASNTAMTVEAWVRPNASALTTTSSIFNKRDASSAEEYRVAIRPTGALDFITFSSENTRANIVTEDNAMVADVWQHVAAVRDGNRYLLFIDGVLRGTDYTTIAPSTNGAPVQIGRSAFDATRYWDGWIDETRISTEVFYSTRGFIPPAAAFPRGAGLAAIAPNPQIACAYWNMFPDTYSGPCLEIERVSDNAVQDIGFDGSGNIDTAAIATFCGSSNGRIITWYNQSPYGGTGTFVAFGQIANRGVIYNGSTGQMVRNANGHIAWDQAGIEGKMWNHTTVAGPFIAMLCFDTTDTFFVTTGADNNNHYTGLGQSGSTSNFVANDGGTTPDATTSYFKNGVLTPVSHRGDYFTKFGDGNVHRWAVKVPNMTPTNPTGIGVYDDGTGSVSMNNGHFAGYALVYRSALTDTQITAIDTYLASKLI